MHFLLNLSSHESDLLYYPLTFLRNATVVSWVDWCISSHAFFFVGLNKALVLMVLQVKIQYSDLFSVSIDAAPESVKLMDPCSPRGYPQNLMSLKLSPSSFLDRTRHLSSLYPSGNFSECRSASLSLLQKGKGLLFLLLVIENMQC